MKGPSLRSRASLAEPRVATSSGHATSSMFARHGRQTVLLPLLQMAFAARTARLEGARRPAFAGMGLPGADRDPASGQRGRVDIDPASALDVAASPTATSRSAGFGPQRSGWRVAIYSSRSASPSCSSKSRSSRSSSCSSATRSMRSRWCSARSFRLPDWEADTPAGGGGTLQRVWGPVTARAAVLAISVIALLYLIVLPPLFRLLMPLRPSPGSPSPRARRTARVRDGHALPTRTRARCRARRSARALGLGHQRLRFGGGGSAGNGVGDPSGIHRGGSDSALAVCRGGGRVSVFDLNDRLLRVENPEVEHGFDLREAPDWRLEHTTSRS